MIREGAGVSVMDIAPRGTLRDISVLLLRQMCLLITYIAMTSHTYPVL